jgi:hypothetical protein
MVIEAAVAIGSGNSPFFSGIFLRSSMIWSRARSW